MKNFLGAMIFGMFLALAYTCTADAAYKESYYSQSWCAAQPDFIKVEHSIRGGRVDCLLARYAVEVEWAHKWKEGIAQARWYALQTGKMPAILLIIRKESDTRYEQYIEEYAHNHGFFIKVFIIWERKE